MKKYSHILVPLDFSDSTEVILRRALCESRLHSARLSLLHVIEYYPEDVPPGIVPAENANPIEVYLRRARDHLARLAEENASPGAQQVAVTDAGAAYHEIVRFASENAVDLIVMGYTGRWVTDALGSTAMAVTRHVVCDVLLVRNRDSQIPES